MNEELQAQALAAWLDACGSGAYIPAPPILDADVVEAIYALHPEFARPPRFNMDELLGELKHGPLAAKVQPPSLPEVEVSVLAVEPANRAPVASRAPVAASRHRVEAAPADTSPRAASRQGPRPNERVWTRWMTSGAVGFTAAAAAWLLVISGEPAHETAHEAAATVTAAPAAPRPAPDAAVGAAPAGSGLAEVAAAPTSKAVVAEAALPSPATAAPAAPLAEVTVAEGAVGAAAGGIAPPLPPPPPQAAAQGLVVADAPAVDAVATAPQRAPRDEEQALQAPSAPMATNAGNTAVIAESEAKSLKDASNVRRADVSAKAEMEADDADLSASGESAGPSYTDWRSGLSTDQRVRLEGAIASAEAQAQRGDPGAAARSLQPFIIQPARAGLNVAARAAEFALQANDPRLATSLCERALKLGGAGTQERSRVDALLTKARQQSATLQLPR